MLLRKHHRQAHSDSSVTRTGQVESPFGGIRRPFPAPRPPSLLAPLLDRVTSLLGAALLVLFAIAFGLFAAKREDLVVDDVVDEVE